MPVAWSRAPGAALLTRHQRACSPFESGIGCHCPRGTVIDPPDDPDWSGADEDEYEPEPTYEVEFDPDFDPDYDPEYDPATDDDGGYPHGTP